jgi:hypothetical protein
VSWEEEIAAVLAMDDASAAAVLEELRQEAAAAHRVFANGSAGAIRRVAAINRALDALRGRTETNIRADERERIARFFDTHAYPWAASDVARIVRDNLQQTPPESGKADPK